MADFIITTTSNVEGFKVVEYLDVIFEENIFGVSMDTTFQSFGDIFKGFSGERLDAISNRIEDVKNEVKRRFIRKALAIGANAIIGMDIETTQTQNGGIHISMSGTAVILESL